MSKDVSVNHILIVDHNTDLFHTLASIADSEKYHIVHTADLHEGLTRLASEKFDIILIQELLLAGDPRDSLCQIAEFSDPPAVIVAGSKNDPVLVENLLKNGVWEYLPEDQSATSFLSSLQNILTYRRQSQNSNWVRDCHSEKIKEKGIIGSSPGIQSCLDLVAKAGPSDANVLIIGESGTGKELFAKAIHSVSRRSNKEMIVVDCAALPDNLVESVLFGHVRGAFTSADRASEGLIRQAQDSTLFFDEIGELSPDIQKKLLRVLQERRLRPVGGSTTFGVDFRLLAATNKDLEQLALQGLFREDLLFRLKTLQIDLPTLRNRPSDIPELAYYFMDSYCKTKRIETKRFSPEFLLVLRRYHWPGNVRELFNNIERSITLALDSDVLLPLHLPINTRVQAIDNIREKEAEEEEITSTFQDYDDSKRYPSLSEVRSNGLERIERKYLQDILRRCKGNIKESCKTAGISRSRFYALLKKYQISPS